MLVFLIILSVDSTVLAELWVLQNEITLLILYLVCQRFRVMCRCLHYDVVRVNSSKFPNSFPLKLNNRIGLELKGASRTAQKYLEISLFNFRQAVRRSNLFFFQIKNSPEFYLIK